MREAIKSGSADAMEDEMAICFVVANIARHLKVDPEKAVRRTNGKFISRFKHLEALPHKATKNIIARGTRSVLASRQKAEKGA